jgi:hypothetical protein
MNLLTSFYSFLLSLSRPKSFIEATRKSIIDTQHALDIVALQRLELTNWQEDLDYTDAKLRARKARLVQLLAVETATANGNEIKDLEISTVGHSSPCSPKDLESQKSMP